MPAESDDELLRQDTSPSGDRAIRAIGRSPEGPRRTPSRSSPARNLGGRILPGSTVPFAWFGGSMEVFGEVSLSPFLSRLDVVLSLPRTARAEPPRRAGG